MGQFVRLSKSTVNTLEYFIDKLQPSKYFRFPRSHYRHFYLNYHEQTLVDLDELRGLLIELDSIITRNENQLDEISISLEGDEDNWLLCEEDLEVIPVYKDAISISAFRYIIEPKQIQNLLHFVQIPSTKNGVVTENHGHFGYHFHYGKVKSGSLQRTNVLLTFDPNEVVKDSDTERKLYSEYHAEGHSLHLDVNTIGENKRLPIYLVCCQEAKKRGFENFKRLKQEAHVFYPH